jgi:heat shock protein HtpX
MLIESMLLVGLTFHFMLKGEPTRLMESSRRLFDIFHDVNFGLNLLGVLAAGCAAIFIQFGKSRISLSKAFPQIRFLEAPLQVKEMITRLSTAAGISAPDVCLIDSGVPSAFTVRANRRYSVTLSVGLLESLEDSEVEACLAHEIAHLKNNDFTVRFLATLAKVALFARPLSYLLEPAVYRAREFLADSTAAKLVGGPDALISAFSKLNESSDFESALPNSTCVCNLNVRNGLLRIFDKHPRLEDRLRMLMEMKQN